MKIKLFVKPHYKNNDIDYKNFEYGGFYMGVGYEYPEIDYIIKSIDFGCKQVEMYTTGLHNAIYYAFGMQLTTQWYNFDDIEVVKIEYNKTELSDVDFELMVVDSKKAVEFQNIH